MCAWALQEGLAPLHVAAAQGYGEMVSILALLGANLDARSRVTHSLIPSVCSHLGSAVACMHAGGPVLACSLLNFHI